MYSRNVIQHRFPYLMILDFSTCITSLCTVSLFGPQRGRRLLYNQIINHKVAWWHVAYCKQRIAFPGLPQKAKKKQKKQVFGIEQTPRNSLENPVSTRLFQPRVQSPRFHCCNFFNTHTETYTPSITAWTGRVGAGCQVCSAAGCPCSPLGAWSKVQQTATRLETGCSSRTPTRPSVTPLAELHKLALGAQARLRRQQI